MSKITDTIRIITNLSALILMFVGLCVGTVMTVFTFFYMFDFGYINPIVNYPLLFWYGAICWFTFFGILIYPGVKEERDKKKQAKNPGVIV